MGTVIRCARHGSRPYCKCRLTTNRNATPSHFSTFYMILKPYLLSYSSSGRRSSGSRLKDVLTYCRSSDAPSRQPRYACRITCLVRLIGQLQPHFKKMDLEAAVFLSVFEIMSNISLLSVITSEQRSATLSDNVVYKKLQYLILTLVLLANCLLKRTLSLSFRLGNTPFITHSLATSTSHSPHCFTTSLTPINISTHVL